MSRFVLRVPSDANPSDIRSLASTLRATGRALLFGLRLWAAVRQPGIANRDLKLEE